MVWPVVEKCELDCSTRGRHLDSIDNVPITMSQNCVLCQGVTAFHFSN